MGKVDELLSTIGGNIDESLGVRSNQMPSVGSSPKEVSALPSAGRQRDRDFGTLEIDRVACTDQPREEFDEESLKHLAESIKQHGQLSPIRVRWDRQNSLWVVVSGERRFRASKLAGLKTVRCHFIETELSPSQILEEQIVENLHRADLTPVEQAKAYQKLMELNGWKAKDLAEHLHLPKSSLSEALSLLKLPEDIQVQVDQGVIPATAATELSRVKDEETQRQLASDIAQGKRTREETKKVVRRRSSRDKASQGEGSQPRKKRTTTEEFFRAPNGVKVALTANKRTTDEQLAEALRYALDEVLSRSQTKEAA